MENNINIATEVLRQQLVSDINKSGLPISTLYLVVNELQWKTEKAYYAELNAPAQKVLSEESNNFEEVEVTEGESE